MSILTLSAPRSSVDESNFRDAMSRLASGVAIAACWDGNTPRGLLVSSLTALSTDPPRVLFCVQKKASAHDALLLAQECSLSLLAEDDLREAQRFSSSHLSEERFRSSDWRLDPHRPPEHRGGLVRLAGHIDQKMDAGSHSIFVVRVASAHSEEQRPLVYFARDFHRVLPLREAVALPSKLEQIHDRPN